MNPDSVTWRLVDLLNTAKSFLDDKGIENPRGNAEALLGKALGLPRIELYLQHDRPLSEKEVESFRNLVRRRLNREPLQLILGSVEFCGVEIEIESGLLIPRAETEEMTADIIKILPSFEKDKIHVLDIGCGTGCISVALAAADKRIYVDAVDSDPKAISVTKRNALNNGVPGRVRTIQADIFSDSFANRVETTYDIIVSNPPYIADDELERLEPEVRDYESRHALVAEKNCLMFYERIAELLPSSLNENGLVVLEFGAGQADSVRDIFEPRLHSFEIRRDLSNHPRCLFGRMKWW